MKHLSTFNGIGGFMLAAHWVGWENVAYVEKDEFCNEITKAHFPAAIEHKDIKTFNAKQYYNAIDIISGGDPCQPSSQAGLQKGTADDRYLWPEMFKTIRAVQSPWVINENVYGSLSNGIVDIKIDDLESEGYEVQPYCLPVEAFGGLHQRDRIWIVAYNSNFHRNRYESRNLREKESIKSSVEKQQYCLHQFREPVDLWSFNSDSDIERFKKQHHSTESNGFSEKVRRYFGYGNNTYGDIPRHVIESSIVGMLNGLPEGMDYTERNKRIKAIGNAVSPVLVYELFDCINKLNYQYEKGFTTN